jgi:single-strand DNA-binding protein
MNRVTLIGNLGNDPEVRNLPNGGKVVGIRLATTESWRDKQTGERRDATEWHNISIFNEGIGKVAEQYLKKGSKVMVEGQLKTRKWQDQNGNDRYSTEIHLGNFGAQMILLGDKSEGDGGAPRSSSGNGGQQQSRPPQRSSQPAFETGGMDDDIPF